MKNRFIEYLLEKQRRAEEIAMEESARLYDDSDPTQYDPFKDEAKEEQ